jgi:hypothetical protein
VAAASPTAAAADAAARGASAHRRRILLISMSLKKRRHRVLLCNLGLRVGLRLLVGGALARTIRVPSAHPCRRKSSEKAIHGALRRLGLRRVILGRLRRHDVKKKKN